MKQSTQCWAVVPAAGTGSRMGSDIPKQYMSLLGTTLIEYTLQCLTASNSIAGIVVAVGAEDKWWRTIELDTAKPVITVTGGVERCCSVLNALDELIIMGQTDEWVLVHDAARPCVRMTDIEKLVLTLQNHPVGGLLGAPLSDTVKRADGEGNITATVDRQGLWRALTPQMFRLQPLRSALNSAIANQQLVTDEASAMEMAGYTPQMVEGHADNIKITRPADLAMAEFFLQQQDNQPCV